MKATDINCNSELIRERKEQQQRDELVWNRFRLVQELKQTQKYDDEIRYARMYALDAIAKHKGYKFSSPKVALKYESLLVKPAEEHICDPNVCEQLNMKRGQPYIDPDSERVFRASGAIYLCRDTLSVHICAPGKACNRSAIMPDDPTSGYMCMLTQQCKATMISNRPKYEENQRVGKTEIDAIEKSDALAGIDPMGLYVGVEREEKLLVDQEWRKQNYSPVTNHQILQQYMLRNQGLGMLYNATHTESIEDLASVLAEQQVAAVQHLKQETKRQQEWSTPPAKRVKRSAPLLPRAELTPDQRSEQYMKRLEGKEELIYSIISFLTGQNAKRYLINSARADAADSGNKKVSAMLRRHPKKRHALLDCFSIWLRAAQPILRPKPQVWRLSEAEIALYTQALHRLWFIIAHSPHARDLTIRKKHPLNFTKVAFGMLYTIGLTGLVCDCTLEEDLLQIAEVQREGPLFRIVSRFPVIMLPLSKTLGAVLLSKNDVQQLHKWTGSGVKYDKHVVFQGTALLVECYNSMVNEYKETLKRQLTDDPCNAGTHLQSYVDSCLACKLVL